MKKIIFVLIASFLLMSLAACRPQDSQDSQSSQDSALSGEESTLPGEESESSTGEEEHPRPALDDGWWVEEHEGYSEYFTFTYNKEKMDTYTQERVGNRGEGCKVDCYYLLKYTGKVPKLVYEEPVYVSDVCENALYFASEDRLMVTDYEVTQVRELYRAQYGTIQNMWHHRQALFLLDGEMVVRVDLETETSKVIAECPGIRYLRVLNTDYFLWEREDQQRILHQISTQTDRWITDDEEWATYSAW